MARKKRVVDLGTEAPAAGAGASEVRLKKPEAPAAEREVAELLAWARGPLLDTIEELETQQHRVRAVLLEWSNSGGRSWTAESTLRRVMGLLGLEEEDGY